MHSRNRDNSVKDQASRRKRAFQPIHILLTRQVGGEALDILLALDRLYIYAVHLVSALGKVQSGRPSDARGGTRYKYFHSNSLKNSPREVVGYFNYSY